MRAVTRTLTHAHKQYEELVQGLNCVLTWARAVEEEHESDDFEEGMHVCSHECVTESARTCVLVLKRKTRSYAEDRHPH